MVFDINLGFGKRYNSRFLCTVIVNKLLNNFESKLETKFETKLTQVTNNMQEKIDALSLEKT